MSPFSKQWESSPLSHVSGEQPTIQESARNLSCVLSYEHERKYGSKPHQTKNPSKSPTSCFPPPGPPHSDEAEHHAGEAGPEVRGSSSLRAGRFAQHRQDSHPHAAGRVPAARQWAHARRPAALGPQFGSRGRSSSTSQPPQQRLDPGTEASASTLYPWELQEWKKHLYSLCLIVNTVISEGYFSLASK